MQIRVDPRSGPIYRQIVEQVLSLVSSGRLQPGDQLPPVRKLAEQLLVNPNTVARAYRELVSLRVLTGRWGSGVYVARRASKEAGRGQQRELTDRIDRLVGQARAMGLGADEIVELVAERARKQLKKEA